MLALSHEGSPSVLRTPDEVRQEYRYLEHDDIDQCLAYAAWKLDERDDVLG